MLTRPFQVFALLSSAEARVMRSERRKLVRDSGSKGNKWTKERLCRGEYLCAVIFHGIEFIRK